MKIKYLLLTVCAASLNWSCVDNSKDEDNFDVTKILDNVADNIILPQFEELKSSTDELKSAYSEFEHSGEQEDLIALQNTFKESYSLWQSCSFVNYGNSNLVSLSSTLNTYPTDVDQITSTFNTTEEYNLESGSFANAIGYPGLDYLFFEGDESEIKNRVEQDGKTYCLKNIDLIQSTSKSAYSFWKENTDNFYSDFKTTSSKSKGSPFSLFVNGFIKSFEVLKNGQLGFPAGKFTLNQPQPNESEALYSGISLQLFKAHLANLERVYKGQSLDGTDGIGLDDYLQELNTTRNGENLNELILGVFSTLKEKADLLEGTTNEAVANQSDLVNELYAKTKELVAYLKVDMTYAINVQITYIDSDGD